MLNILHCTNNPIAGAPFNLYSILNKYSTKVKCRFIAASASNGKRVFSSDIIVDDLQKDLIFNCFKHTDIIHFHNFYEDCKVFEKWPELWNIAKSKPHIWQVHTQRNCDFVPLHKYAKSDAFAKKLVIAQYHVAQYPEATPVPNMIDIWDLLYTPLPSPPLVNHGSLPFVIFTPSNINLLGWDNKGWEFTIPILRKLSREGLIQYKTVTDTPHAETMLARRFADIGIDQAAVPSYHLCSLENMALGLANVVHYDDIILDAIEKVTGTRTFPSHNAHKGTLERVLRKLSGNNEELLALRKESRKWMETYWNPKEQIKIYEDIYSQV